MSPTSAAKPDPAHLLERLQEDLDNLSAEVWQMRPLVFEPQWVAQAAVWQAQGRPQLPDTVQPDPDAVVFAGQRLASLLEAALPNDGAGFQGLVRWVQADPVQIFDLIWRDQGGDLLARIRAAKLPEELAVLFAVLLARPFRSWIAQELHAESRLDGWKEGSCPLCGHWPSLSLIADQEEGRRYLWCLHCGTSWRHPRLRCSFCGCTDQAQLLHLHLEERPEFRLEGCRSCKRYVKEFRSTEERANLPWEALFLGTAALDLIAADHGLLRDSPLIGATTRQFPQRTQGPRPVPGDHSPHDHTTSSNPEKNR